MDGQRLGLGLALGLRDHPSVTGLTVHVSDGAALPTAPTALQEQNSELEGPLHKTPTHIIPKGTERLPGQHGESVAVVTTF